MAMKTILPMAVFAFLAGTACQQFATTEQRFESSVLQPVLSSMEPVRLQQLDQDSTPEQGTVRYLVWKTKGMSRQYPQHFFLDWDGSRVVAKNLTSGSDLGPSIRIEEASLGDWSMIQIFVQGSEVPIPVAAWQTDDQGRASRVHLRKEPCIEWFYDTSEENLNGGGKVSILWRPYSNGQGDGGWQLQ